MESKIYRWIKKNGKEFFLNKEKCYLLIVNKKKSFDRNIKGDFNLKNTLVTREGKDNLNRSVIEVEIEKFDYDESGKLIRKYLSSEGVEYYHQFYFNLRIY